MPVKESAVIYVRYSSHRQGEKSVEGQLTEARDYARRNGFSIVREYIDRAISGKTDDREQFQLMLRDTAKNQFTAIITWRIDRFGRNREEIAFNKYRCKKNGVRIIYVADNIPDTPEGIILEAVMEGMAEYYSVQLATNVMRGMKNAARKGQSVGGTIPLGYRTAEDKRLELDPETAPIVRKIFEMYAAGSTQKEIIEALNADGVRNRKGGPLTINSIRTALHNKKYIGIYHYNNGEIEIEGGIPPIVDTEMFFKVQDMMIENKRAPARKWTKADYLLTGRLFCGSCGGTMVGESGTSKNGNKHLYYNCLAKKRRQGCHKKAIKKQWIESLVIERAKKIVFDDELLGFISENTYQYYVAQNTDTSYTDSLRAELVETERALANILKAIEAGIFNDTTKQRMDELDERKKGLEAAIAESGLRQGLRLTKEHIFYFLSKYREVDYSDPEAQKRLIATFINSVFVYDDKVVMTFNYSGDNRTITLNEVDAGISSGVECSFASCCGSPKHQDTNTVYIIRNVFAIIIKTADR